MSYFKICVIIWLVVLSISVLIIDYNIKKIVVGEGGKSIFFSYPDQTAPTIIEGNVEGGSSPDMYVVYGNKIKYTANGYDWECDCTPKQGVTGTIANPSKDCRYGVCGE